MQHPPYLTVMVENAKHAMENAYAPYSHFCVGCCLRTEGGQLFLGSNVENSAYPSSQCAEASAIGAMITNGERKITDLVVMTRTGAFGSPCGNCRQRINEFASPKTCIYIFTPEKHLQNFLFTELLPYSFRSSE